MSVNEWIETAVRAPTREDADEHGQIFKADADGLAWTGDWNRNLEDVKYWLPIPPLPKRRDKVEEAYSVLQLTFGCSKAGEIRNLIAAMIEDKESKCG